MMPLPQLVDGLGRHRLEVVRKAHTMHLKALQMLFTRNSWEDSVAWRSRLEDHLSKMAIFFETICNHVSRENSNSAFSQRVILCTLDHIDILMKELQSAYACRALSEYKKAIEEMLTFHGNQLLRMQDVKNQSPQTTVVDVHSSSLEDETWIRWGNMCDTEVMKSAVQDTDSLQEVQRFFLSKRGWNQDDWKSRFETYLNTHVLELLKDKQMDEVKSIFGKMKWDPEVKLKSICLNTEFADIRNYLALELNQLHLLSQVELDAWKFLLSVEQVMTDKNLVLSESGKVLNVLNTSSEMKALSLQTLMLIEPQTEWRKSTVILLYFETLDRTLEPYLDMEMTWKYLLANKLVPFLKRWIDAVYKTSTCDVIEATNDRLETLFSSWHLPQHMIDYVSNADCDKLTTDEVLDHLSRYGVYTTEESSDIRKVLFRMVRTGRLMDTEVRNDQILEFIIQNNLPDILAVSNLNVTQSATDWVQLYESFKKLRENLERMQSVYECVCLTSEFVKSLPATDSILALGTVVLSSNAIRDILEKPDLVNSIMKKDELLSSLKSFPRLWEDLVRNHSISSVDLTLITLLKEHFEFKLDHLVHCLSWNSGPAREEEDTIWKELPHFSSENLIECYGHYETLSFRYYLKQGRPSFAASLVLADQLLSYGKFSHKLSKKACFSAHGLSLCHFTNPHVTCSCAAFIEMLGGSSVTQRVHVAAANLVLASEKILEGDEQIIEKDLLHMLQDIALGERSKAAEKLLVCVEHVVEQERGFSAIKAQGLAVRLATIHRLPHPSAFLQKCAARNDWMTFLLVSEIYNYPLDVVKKLIVFFRCSSLRQHIEHVLNRMESSFKSLPTTEPSNTSRHHYYSKIFKHKTQTLSSSGASKSPGTESPLSVRSVLETETLMDQLSEKRDLFYVLLACSQAKQPAIAFFTASLLLPCPVLSVFAVCIEPDWSWRGFCTWLASWLPEDRRLHFAQKMRSHLLSAEDFECVLLDSLELAQPALVLSAFRIFLPDVALVHVAEAIEKSAHEKLFNQAVSSLIRFRNVCQVCDGARVHHLPEEASYLEDSKYLSGVGAQMIYKALESCFLSASDQRLFLCTLVEAKFFDGVTDVTLNTHVLLNVMDILSPLNLNLNLKNWLKNYSDESKNCVDMLVLRGLYRQAREVASLAGAEVASIVMAEQSVKFEHCLQSAYKDVKMFCRDCIEDFQQAEIDPVAVCTFLCGCVPRLHSNIDRWLTLHSALKMLPAAEVPKQLEFEMWKYCLQKDSNSLFETLKVELTATPLNKLHSEHLDISDASESTLFSVKLTSEESDNLEHLIDLLLDIGDLTSVCRLRSLFGAKHEDLMILTSCINLVEDNPSKIKLPEALLSQITHTPARSEEENDLTSSLGSDFELIPSVGKKEPLAALQALSRLLKHGQQIGLQICACYQMAVNLKLSYKDVTAVVEPFKLLRSALSEVHTVASDIITALKLSPHDAAQFVSQEVIAAISKSSTGPTQECVMWGCDLETNFHRVVDIVPDPALLGNELLNMMWKLTTPNKEQIPKGVLFTAVELLIRSHDCHTAVCSMEGIANVLRGVSSLADILSLHSQWALMVRLLIGIQRYTEMSYIFKLLKENDRFEYLLRKDTVKHPSLKVAIFDWLRRQCPDDRALPKMAAAHFKMHREEASLWETEGNQRLQTLVTRGLSNDDETKRILHITLQDFSHAAECYLQANMVNHAVASAHQAELVALQIHFVNTASDQSPRRVLLLDTKSVAQLITTSLSFPEAQILARSYNYHTDWVAALFHHCVAAVSGAGEYFSAWSASFELTPTIIQGVAQRYQRAPVVTQDMAANMRRLLSYVEDIDVQYKLASELGLKDFVEDLLQAPEVAYLKDTVWQLGYKL